MTMNVAQTGVGVVVSIVVRKPAPIDVTITPATMYGTFVNEQTW